MSMHGAVHFGDACISGDFSRLEIHLRVTYMINESRTFSPSSTLALGQLSLLSLPQPNLP